MTGYTVVGESRTAASGATETRPGATLSPIGAALSPTDGPSTWSLVFTPSTVATPEESQSIGRGRP